MQNLALVETITVYLRVNTQQENSQTLDILYVRPYSKTEDISKEAENYC